MAFLGTPAEERGSVEPSTRAIETVDHTNLTIALALHAGAMGYINKQEATGRIIEAILCVIGGRVYLSESMADRLLRRAVGGVAGGDRSPVESLSDRELEVFRLIGAGLTTAEVAGRMQRGVHTVETYRQQIKDKLGLRTAAELARAAARWALEGG